MLVNRGRPTLALEKERKLLNPGDFLVIDPDCASGWIDRPGGTCDLLVWIWRTQPRSAELTPETGKYRQWTITPKLLQKLQQLHSLCHEEVERPDELTKLAIEQLHIAIDVTITRLIRRKTQSPEPSLRMELALRWMAQNLAEPNPVGPLCDYLQISAATLARMFRTHQGQSPAQYHQQVRMERARDLLKANKMSVKEVAYALGYNHPNDFSRAFKQFAGVNPKSCQSEKSDASPSQSDVSVVASEAISKRDGP